MKPEVRRQLLEVLGELSEHTPDVRFGQLLANLSYMAKSFTSEAIWDVEDEELLEAAKSHLEDLSAACPRVIGVDKNQETHVSPTRPTRLSDDTATRAANRQRRRRAGVEIRCGSFALVERGPMGRTGP